MRFYLLHEARKATNRSQTKQRLDYSHRGLSPKAETQVRDNSSWQQKVAKIFHEMDLNGDQHKGARRRVMSALKGVERKRGRAYLQKMKPSTFRGAIQTMLKDYDLQRSRPVAHQRPGISGVYDFNTHPGIKVGPTQRARWDMADVDDHDQISGRELKGHYHPGVQRIGHALDPHKSDHKLDKAVVYDLNDVPYYIFIQPHKVAPKAVEGSNKLYAMLPEAMHFKSLGITQAALLKYFKRAKWNDLMRGDHFFQVDPKGETGALEDVAKKLQLKAWKACFDWFNIRQGLAQWSLVRERLDTKEQELKARTGQSLNQKDEDLHTQATEHELASKNALMGKPPGFTMKDRAFQRHYEEVARNAKEAYTWYVWLMASEFEYGMQVPGRIKLFPQFPTVPTKTKRHESTWAIQPERESGSSKWDKTILRGLGYNQNDWNRFTRHLQKSNYNFVSSDAEIKQLWVPLVGKLRERYGLKIHPQNIANYLAHAKRELKAKAVAGRKNNQLHVRAEMQTPKYTFHGGSQGREFALVPAVGYLQYFDSPFHGGERLIQGREKFSLPVARKLTRKSGSSWNPQTQNKMKLRSDAYKARKMATGWEPKTPRNVDRFDHENMDARRERADIIAAERILQLRKETQRVADIMARETDGHTPLKKYGYNPVSTGVVLNTGLSPTVRRKLRAQAAKRGQFVSKTVRTGPGKDDLIDLSKYRGTRAKKRFEPKRVNITQRRAQRAKAKREAEKRMGYRRN